MNDDTLPPLPEPVLERHEYEAWGQNMLGDFFSTEQMHAYARAAIATALDETKRLREINAGLCRTHNKMVIHDARQAEKTERLSAALRLIAETDPIDAALDPQRAVRVARDVLGEKQ